MENMQLLIDKYGSKKVVAEKLGITVRYVEMILAGTVKPGKSLEKLIKICLI
jgi:hypothetical protein